MHRQLRRWLVELGQSEHAETRPEPAAHDERFDETGVRSA
jgi:hypothetical protein